MIPVWVNIGGRYSPSTDSWTATSTTNAPSGPFLSHCRLDRQRNDRLGRKLMLSPTVLILAADTIPAQTVGRPPGPQRTYYRFHHPAVWTGSEMIVWGGTPDPRPNLDGTPPVPPRLPLRTILNTGGRYCAPTPRPTPTPRRWPTPFARPTT